MAKKKELSGSALDFGKALFSTKIKKMKSSAKEEAVKAEKAEKKQKAKEYCPFCGKGFVNVKRHIKSCPLNPDIIKKESEEYYFKEPRTSTYETRTRRKMVYIEEEITKPNWAALIAEGVQTLKSLTEYLNDLRKNPIRIKLIK
ncbi:MAG: hypothetical protein ACTSPW_14435 [Promethearchaeota archaeon]